MHVISAEVESLVQLANMEEDEIAALVGREAARQVHRFFNRNLMLD